MFCQYHYIIELITKVGFKFKHFHEIFIDLGQVSLENGQQLRRFAHEELPSSPDLAHRQTKLRPTGMREALVAQHCNALSPMLDVAQRSGPSVAPS
jgi:hypothetical protein